MFKRLKVIDLGCNVGAFSLWIYPQADKIWAIDSEKEHLDNFNETIKDNKLDKIQTFQERLLDLSEFMRGHNVGRVDVLKIDIEGDEMELFKNDFPSHLVSSIVGEYHKESPELLLKRLGYEYIELPDKHFIARK